MKSQDERSITTGTKLDLDALIPDALCRGALLHEPLACNHCDRTDEDLAADVARTTPPEATSRQQLLSVRHHQGVERRMRWLKVSEANWCTGVWQPSAWCKLNRSEFGDRGMSALQNNSTIDLSVIAEHPPKCAQLILVLPR
jgi:hypothetical protein